MRFLRYIFCALLFVTASVAETININWMNGDETYAQTTCEIGGDIILPEPPTKRGYTFKGWVTGYTRLEYIESTGTQYIDTGISPADLGNSNPWIEAEFSMEQTGDIDWFGTNNATSNTIIWDVAINADSHNATAYYPRWGIKTSMAGHTIYEAEHDVSDWGFYGAIHKLRLEGINPTKMYVDDVLIATLPFITNSMDSTASITLSRGRSNANSAKWRRFSAGNSNGTLINAIAAKDSNNAIGMYDTVSKQFFTNAGTGEFIAGPAAENQNFYE